LLFVSLREPVAPDSLAELDEVRRTGGMVMNTAFGGMVACRHLHPWSAFHGGEALGVEILEIANLPAVGATIAVDFAGSAVGFRRLLPVCVWTWILAAAFLTLASAQWWIVGLIVERLSARFSRRRTGVV
jgi:hypothetical protein